MELVVHRGANKIAPENTIACAELCIELEVDFVEIDVRLSKERIPFLLHDSSVDRTTNGSGPIIDLNADQIESLDAGSWFDPKYAGEKIPRLETYFRWIKGKSKVFLDMKDPLLKGHELKNLVDLVYETGMEKNCFFSFQETTKPSSRAKELSEIAPDLLLKINADSLEEVQQAKQHYNADIVETSLKKLTDEYKELCQDLKLKSMIWECRSDPDLYKKLLRSGADMINLNNPHLFLQLKKEMEESQ